MEIQMNMLRKSMRVLRTLLKVPNIYLAKKIYLSGTNLNNVAYNFRSQSVLLKKYSIVVDKKRLRFVIDGLQFVDLLADKCQAVFSTDGKGGLNVHCQGIHVRIQTWEELYIMKEVFVDGIYNFNIKDKVCVVDIGMNVGIASLWFALKENVRNVYSYEPLPETYMLAEGNLALNPRLKQKIHAANYGIAESDKTLSVEYLSDFKGSVGILGLPSEMKSHASKNEIKSIAIPLKDVVKEMSEVVKRCNGLKIVAKIDCEGAEYEIIRNLSKSKMLDKICILMIEWHEKGPSEIMDTLVSHGFVMFSLGPVHNRVGMLYAVRRGNDK
jgi:FkbM family methyltransferase